MPFQLERRPNCSESKTQPQIEVQVSKRTHPLVRQGPVARSATQRFVVPRRLPLFEHPTRPAAFPAPRQSEHGRFLVAPDRSVIAESALSSSSEPPIHKSVLIRPPSSRFRRELD